MANAKQPSSSRRTPAKAGSTTGPRFNWTAALIAGGLAAAVVVVVFVIMQVRGRNSGDIEGGRAAEADASSSIPGAFVNLPEIYGGPYRDTAPHVAHQVDYASDCSATNPDVCNSNPPTGGPHWSGSCGNEPLSAPAFCGPAPWGVYTEPWDPETLVHNMEHGGVVLWYNTDDQAIVVELQDLFTQRGDDGQHLVMSPYPDMEEDTIAITSWSRVDKFPVTEYSIARIEEFIDVNLERFNPEGF